ncbi:MAG: chemotaxis response regulator protein-glutamate methylesterase [Desulfobacterium sp.]|jgi:two-component system chemotaxis response regulator CheB|nr:chemotaxis response regulator protein-glutamate methylesterase [Desulfobacterium sp.]
MDLLRVLVVDDTIIYRKIIGDVLKEIPGIEVVGVAHNGKIALSKIKTLKPDLVTLDIEMPEMSGIEVLEAIRTFTDAPGVIMLSTLTHRGSEMTIKALELGAFDFIGKPDSGTMAENLVKVRKALEPIIAAFKRHRQIQTGLKQRAPHRVTPPLPGAFAPKIPSPPPYVRQRTTPSAIVAIGISTGGPNALAKMMPRLKPELNVPILVVQHMPPLFTASLAKSLNAKCSLLVKEAVNGEALMPNTVYIAPGGLQMKIVAGPDGQSRNIRITDDPPENSCRPSVDYLFRSIAEHYVGRATAVIMTGMGSDGTRGLALMKKNGAIIIAQDKESCTVYGMPKEPIESGLADIVAPLDKIADRITKTVIR